MLLPEVPKISGYKGTMLIATEVPAEMDPPELPNGVDLAVLALQDSAGVVVKTPPPYQSLRGKQEYRHNGKNAIGFKLCSPTGGLLQEVRL